jgi:hypothetical protein
VQQLDLLSYQLGRQLRDDRDVAARLVEAGDAAGLDRVDSQNEDDRNGRGRSLCGAAAGALWVTITDTGRRTGSAAKTGNLSYSSCAQAYSIATF